MIDTNADANMAERVRLHAAHDVAEHLMSALATAGRAMAALLDGTGADGWQGPEPGASPSTAEDAAGLAGDTLARSARRLLELHRLEDGPGIADFARACLAYSAALHVAAAGRWPEDLDAIHAAMRRALQAVEADTRLTAKGALRAHALDAERLRAIGPAGVTLAARIDHECRHALTELHRIASAPAAITAGAGLF
ncbi:hypothetical protein [Fulvimonas yonginensis]|uniref:Uncharacterized protein n=1 Tax=Fulvimonas yonginensis TaxID=1495200 RepID=A0ABU8J9E9_9GAMM